MMTTHIHIKRHVNALYQAFWFHILEIPKFLFYTAINVVTKKVHRNSANINQVTNNLRPN